MTIKINVKGPIVGSNVQRYYDQEKVEAVSPARIEQELNKAGGKDVELYINSNGGSVFAASEIYTLLKEYPGKITAKVVGLAASAASLVVMAANKALISPLGQVMIHNVSTSTYGDSNNHRSSYEMLSGTDKAIANVYRFKTKLAVDKLLDLMQKTTWMNAEKAQELGFVDGVMFDSKDVEPITPASYQEKKLPQNVQAIVENMEQKTLSNYVLAYSSIPLNEEPRVVQQSTKGSGYFVNGNDLKNRQPELYKEVLKAGMDAESKRVSDLRALQNAGVSSEVIEEAIKNGTDAGTIAIDMVKNQKYSLSDEEASNLLLEAAKNFSQQQGTLMNQSKDTEAANILMAAAKNMTME